MTISTYYFNFGENDCLARVFLKEVPTYFKQFDYKYNCYYVTVQVTSEAELKRIKQYYIDHGYWLENKK